MRSPPLHCGRIGCELVSWILYSMCHEFVCNFGSKFFVTISWYPWYLTCCNAATNLGKRSFAVSGCGAREGTGREGKWCSLWRGCSCDGCKNQFIYDTGITPFFEIVSNNITIIHQNSLRYIYLCAKTCFQRNTAWFSVLFYCHLSGTLIQHPGQHHFGVLHWVCGHRAAGHHRTPWNAWKYLYIW